MFRGRGVARPGLLKHRVTGDPVALASLVLVSALLVPLPYSALGRLFLR